MSSNNIYNILNTLKSLEPTPEQTAKATAQSIYESVESQGSVLEGVNSVEARLNEKYMGFKKTVAAVAKGGADNPEAVAASIGRKKYGKAAFQKAAAAGRKMGEGDMEEGNEFSGALAQAKAQHKDEFEVDGKRYPVKENGLQRYTGIKKYGKKGFEALQKAGREGADEEEKGRIKDQYIKKEDAPVAPTATALAAGPIVYLHKAYPENAYKAKETLEKYHAGGPGSKLKFLPPSGKAGPDYVEIHLPRKPHNSIEAIKASLDGEGVKYGRIDDGQNHIAEDRETLQTKKGTIYKGGTYGTEYDPSDEEKKTKAKHVPKTGQKGRPKKDRPAASTAPKGDIFGRTTGEVPKGKKGTKIKGKGNIDTVDEAAKWRNPEYKGKFYTQKKGDSDDYDSIDYGYGMPERPKKDPGQKRRMGGIGDEWEVTDKLSTGHMDIGNTTGGAHWAGTGGSTDMKDWEPSPYKDSNVTKRGPRKGFITKSGINTVKDRIKGALGQHHSPVLPEGADYKKQNFIVESFNFAEMMKETDQTVQEMLTELQNDIQAFKTTGECTPKLDAFLRVHGHTSNKKKLSDAAPVPYEVPAVQRRAAGAPALTPADVQQQDANRSMHPGMTKLDAPKPAESMNQELDELARLAGITDEGNAFTGKLANTPKGGEFELDGKKFKDTSTTLEETTCMECGMYESQCSCNEGNLFTKHLKDTPKGGDFEIDGKHYKDTSNLDEAACTCPSVTCPIHGEDSHIGAEEEDNPEKYGTTLEDIAKLAGIAVEGRDYGDTAIAKPPTYDNTPEEEVMGVDVLTKGGDGEVAGGEKAMHNDKPTHKNADNPLAEADFNPVEAMGRRLMKQYEAIKVAK